MMDSLDPAPVEAILRRLLLLAVLAPASLVLAAPAEAQLLGLEHLLSPPTVEFSADIVMTGDGEPVAGKILRGRDKERRELTIEGEVEIVIVRLDRKLVWSLAPEDKLYVESSLDEALGRVPGPDGKPRQPELKLTTLGSEAVAGHSTTKQRIAGRDADGSPIDGIVWVSEEGIVLRAESDIVDEDGKHHFMRMELKNLRVAPQDPKLFEIPAGYKRVVQSTVGALAPRRPSRAVAADAVERGGSGGA